MGMWTEKVLPAIHKFLWKDDTKKAAEQACKSFDESKGAMNKEFEEKKGVLKPKVIEIHEASSTEIKALIKEPNRHNLKKHSAKVQTFLDELVKIDFPGSKAASETTSKYGPDLGRSPIIFVFEKVSILIASKEVATQATAMEPPTATTTTTREIIVEKAVAKEPEKAKVAAVEPPTTTMAKEIIVEKAVVKEPEKAKVATIVPPTAATIVPPTAATTAVPKEIIVEKVAAKEPEIGKAATKEPPVTTTVTKEPVKVDAPAKNGKEPSKVEEKKEMPLKP